MRSWALPQKGTKTRKKRGDRLPISRSISRRFAFVTFPIRVHLLRFAHPCRATFGWLSHFVRLCHPRLKIRRPAVVKK